MFVHTVALWLCPAAMAMTPPIGWTMVGSDRALVDPADPSRGEIIELRVTDGSGTQKELVAVLGAKGIEIERFGEDPGGHVNLVSGDRLGRARVQKIPGQTVWWVVLVGTEHSRYLDPDALLQAMAPDPSSVSWGAKEAIMGGHDGSPWGEVASADQAAQGWAQDSAQTPWAQDPDLVGIWEGNARLRGVSTKVRFRFENSGLLQVQRTDHGGETVHEGKWATRTGLLQMDIEDGGANLPYMSTTRTLSLSYAGASITLYKQ